MKSAKRIVVPALMTTVLCVLGPITVPLPFTPIPMSLLNFVVFLMAYLLNWKQCLASYGIYVLIGFVGVPVFSAGGAGAAKVLGPTGGYLLGLFFTAWFCSVVNQKFYKQRWITIVGMIVGLAVSYCFGTFWFMVQQKVALWSALLLCVVPFFVGDGIKIVVAAMIGPKLRQQYLVMSEDG